MQVTRCKVQGASCEVKKQVSGYGLRAKKENTKYKDKMQKQSTGHPVFRSGNKKSIWSFVFSKENTKSVCRLGNKKSIWSLMNGRLYLVKEEINSR